MSKLKKIYIQYFKCEKKNITPIILLILLGLIVTSITPYIYGQIIDFIIKADIKKLFFMLVVYGGLLLISVIAGKLQLYFGQKLVLRIINTVKSNLFQKVLHMKCIDLDGYLPGELLNRIEGDAEEIVNYFLTILTSSISIVINAPLR